MNTNIAQLRSTGDTSMREVLHDIMEVPLCIIQNPHKDAHYNIVIKEPDCIIGAEDCIVEISY